MIVPSIVSARSDEVLTLDVRQVCRGIASQSADPLATGLQASFEECVKSEQGIREQLKQQWPTFSAADKQHCVTLAKTGGESSYTELLTCLEMARDVRALRSAATVPSKRGMTEQPVSSPSMPTVPPVPSGKASKASQPTPAKEPSATSPAKESSVTEAAEVTREVEQAKAEAQAAKASEAVAQRKLGDAEAALQRAKEEAGRAIAEAERAKADAKAARDTEAAARRDVAAAEAARAAAQGREQACQSAAAKAQSGFGTRLRSWFGPRQPDVKNP